VRSRLEESLRISGESSDGVGAFGIDDPHRNTVGTETSDYSQADKIAAEDDRPWIHIPAPLVIVPNFLGRSSTSVCLIVGFRAEPCFLLNLRKSRILPRRRESRRRDRRIAVMCTSVHVGDPCPMRG